ncbi:beta-ketoacyl-[acyl-carrier-protein] synthase family protein [Luteibacter sp. UNCMF366Tsu5.1]|uniref:beta-ketoacyl-[acyl-carrier-protein] synthase family protein n=1 Tax=Luteibacter sp. UNCMF366Tsu5.1 TaxID=1502758 RepID=UPI0009086622|nr:beta-ketoacyl-[acyl-carrier-protein] synthase family protein [Luteibacter sp. UNCMF366Tsu5.1]SFW34445.1 3-oxoacyl-[acyl-carrier-protein] synthase-1 [Luteibacter sp. UNCMF366Tsu5.1]
MSQAYLNALGIACSLGVGKAAVAEALFGAATHGLRSIEGWVPGRSLPLGEVGAALPPVPEGLAHRDTRNNRLLLLAAQEIESDIRAAIARFGAARVAVVVGTSTTGIEEATAQIAARAVHGSWADDYRYSDQELGAPAAFLAEWLGVAGPCYAISTACTSGARALISARRLLKLDLCDAVICGGADTLCRLATHGFHALEATSPERCQPFSRERRGINIGEAAALFLMTRDAAPVALVGGGASSDAYHMSSPVPDGRGASDAMHQALVMAGIDPGTIDYVNLHGTATEHNDAMESHAMADTFVRAVPCSSTKGLTGHTLGAAGALEAGFCWLALHDPQRRLPPHAWNGEADPALPPLAFTEKGASLPSGQRYLMSNSFAFGGNNASLILAGDV